MFVLVQIVDVIPIPPRAFSKGRNMAIRDELNSKYCNKVIPDIGLCVTTYDIVRAGKGVVHPGDGSAWVRVEFRVIVFCPFGNEILEGKISHCDDQGVHVSLGFFSDITIPPDHLLEPSAYDELQGLWYWWYDGTKYWYEPGESARFKVHAWHFVLEDITTPPKVEPQKATQHFGVAVEVFKATPPMQIVGSFNASGLGLIDWWNEEQ
eukprot:TRINITY_DN2187_c0_g1_i1.p1 TRINITY_DN2187_c0_g1~~TRINITY_DN2187_c0_g1_i1.p1  ORF type:complete len:208 (-),score=22.80 TRINITY_DN2187_c0_g1_i1:47-670(-)